jgi:hypothetical protein
MTNTLKQFFLWISATDQTVLAKTVKKESEIRYISLGIVMIFIAIWAFISCYYALSQIFMDETNSIIFVIVSLVYCLTILFIDRTLIASIRIDDSSWIKRAILFLLRLALAFIIGFVIAEPVIIKIFDGEIKKRANEIKEKNSQNNYNLRNSSIDSLYRVTNGEKNYKQEVINNNNNEIIKLQKKRYKIIKRTDEFGNEIEIRIEDKGIANKIMELENQNNRLRSEIQQLDSLFQKNKTNIETFVNTKKELNDDNYKLNQTLLSKHHLLSDIISENKKMFLIYILIVAFFLMIDVLPVVTKTFFFNGEYEMLQKIDNYNHRFQEELNNIKNNHQKELLVLEQNYNTQLFKIKNDYERKVLELKQNHNLELETMKNKNDKILIELSNKENTFEKIKLDHQLKLENLKNDAEYQIQRENVNFEVNINKLKNKQSLEEYLLLLQNYNQHLNNNIVDNYIINNN